MHTTYTCTLVHACRVCTCKCTFVTSSIDSVTVEDSVEELLRWLDWRSLGTRELKNGEDSEKTHET